jgi:hypothetical protein
VGVAQQKKKYFFWQFFSTFEKIIQFLEFCKYQGGKIYVKLFGFLLQIT